MSLQLIRIKLQPHLFNLLSGVCVSFPCAGNHMYCYVMVHICAGDGAQGKSRAEDCSHPFMACGSPSERFHRPSPGGRRQMWGKPSLCCLQLDLLFHTSSAAFSHPFLPLLLFPRADTSHGECRCCLLRLVEAAVTRVSGRICLWLRRHGKSFK